MLRKEVVMSAAALTAEDLECANETETHKERERGIEEENANYTIHFI